MIANTSSRGYQNRLAYFLATAVRRGDCVEVAIADDGVGGADVDAGSGLRGLRDRVEAFGGKLSVESAVGAGTRIVASLPVR